MDRAAAQLLLRQAATCDGRTARLSRRDRLGAGGVAVAGASARADGSNSVLPALQLADALPLLAVRRRLPGRDHATRDRGAQTRAAARCAATLAPTPAWRSRPQGGEVRRLVYANGVIEEQPRIDT